ncbi:MAG: c-type cytochrome [Pseudolabrys sp.]|nr:c-type cytochrome [Pseudolabrys sp.]
MKKHWLLGLAVLVIGSSPANAQGSVERGNYLVNTVLTCGNCHTPKGPTGDIADKAFSGGLRFDEPPFDVTASNITQDKDTGIGTWSAADIKTLLRTGVRPNGVPIAAVMPTGFYDIMTEADIDSVVAYVRTLKPIANKVPDPIYKINVPRQVFPGAEKPIPDNALADKVTRGFYLATIAHCMECHTPLGPNGRDFVNDLGKGGFELKGPWGVSVSRNITSSKEKGIGGWTDAEIKTVITKGVRKDGTALKPPMGYPYYAKMTEADLDDIVAWLRTVPAKD